MLQLLHNKICNINRDLFIVILSISGYPCVGISWVQLTVQYYSPPPTSTPPSLGCTVEGEVRCTVSLYHSLRTSLLLLLLRPTISLLLSCQARLPVINNQPWSGLALDNINSALILQSVPTFHLPPSPSYSLLQCN